MWSIISNPIVSHLIAMAVGAGGAWYATHKTAVAAAAATVKTDIAKAEDLAKKL